MAARNEACKSASSQPSMKELSELRNVEVKEFNRTVKEYEITYGDGDFVQVYLTADGVNDPKITIGRYLDDGAGSEYFAKLGKTELRVLVNILQSILDENDKQLSGTVRCHHICFCPDVLKEGSLEVLNDKIDCSLGAARVIYVGGIRPYLEIYLPPYESVISMHLHIGIGACEEVINKLSEYGWVLRLDVNDLVKDGF